MRRWDYQLLSRLSGKADSDESRVEGDSERLIEYRVTRCFCEMSSANSIIDFLVLSEHGTFWGPKLHIHNAQLSGGEYNDGFTARLARL